VTPLSRKGATDPVTERYESHGEPAILQQYYDTTAIPMESAASVVKPSIPAKGVVSAFERALSELASMGDWLPSCSYPAGVCLLEQSVRPEAVLLLVSGAVKIQYTAPSVKAKTVGLLMRGALIGGIPTILQCPQPVRVSTIVSSQVRSFPASSFRIALVRDHRFCNNVSILTSYEALTYLQSANYLARMPAIDRLKVLLHEFAIRFGHRDSTGVRVAPPLKLGELASVVGISAEHLSRLLKQLQAEGFLQRRKGWLVFPDPPYGGGSLPTLTVV
jgi:CRP-like cAMP-binding protein